MSTVTPVTFSDRFKLDRKLEPSNAKYNDDEYLVAEYEGHYSRQRFFLTNYGRTVNMTQRKCGTIDTYASNKAGFRLSDELIEFIRSINFKYAKTVIAAYNASWAVSSVDTMNNVITDKIQKIVQMAKDLNEVELHNMRVEVIRAKATAAQQFAENGLLHEQLTTTQNQLTEARVQLAQYVSSEYTQKLSAANEATNQGREKFEEAMKELKFTRENLVAAYKDLSDEKEKNRRLTMQATITERTEHVFLKDELTRANNKLIAAGEKLKTMTSERNDLAEKLTDAEDKIRQLKSAELVLEEGKVEFTKLSRDLINVEDKYQDVKKELEVTKTALMNAKVDLNIKLVELNHAKVDLEEKMLAKHSYKYADKLKKVINEKDQALMAEQLQHHITKEKLEQAQKDLKATKTKLAESISGAFTIRSSLAIQLEELKKKTDLYLEDGSCRQICGRAKDS